jgi:hypothetical protein
MSTALLEPPTDEQELRTRAEMIEREVEEALETSSAEEDVEREQRVADRAKWFSELRKAVILVAKSPAWRAHDLARELLVTLVDLEDAIEADPGASDREWRGREALLRMLVVVRAMRRQLMHDVIDRPEQAAEFVATALSDVEVGAVAELLDTSARQVANYRKGEVGQIRKNPGRITLVGQLVFELIPSMTQRGVLLWFSAPMDQLGGRTPRELIDEDVQRNGRALLALARGGRGQLDQGTHPYDALEHGA